MVGTLRCDVPARVPAPTPSRGRLTLRFRLRSEASAAAKAMAGQVGGTGGDGDGAARPSLPEDIQSSLCDEDANTSITVGWKPTATIVVSLRDWRN